MNLRKHMGLLVTGVIALVLAAVAIFMLLRFQSAYGRVRGELKSTVAQLDRLYNRDPYPSDENVVLVQSNLASAQVFFDELVKKVKEDQIEPDNAMEPAAFPQLLDKTIRRLYGQAAQLGVTLPQRFAFGFERYALGALPNREDVPRLVLQLKTIEQLCDLVFKSKIAEIKGVQRTVFEKGATESPDASGGRRRRSMEVVTDIEAEGAAKEWQDPSGLFARETYTVAFQGLDESVEAVLNALAACKMFVVVSGVELVNETPLPQRRAAAPGTRPPAGGPVAGAPAMAAPPVFGFPAPGTGPAGMSAAPVEPPLREERIVAGREPVTATVTLHVYRFLVNESQETEP